MKKTRQPMIDLNNPADPLETMKRLKIDVDAAISYLESGSPMIDMKPREMQQWIEKHGRFDFTVGNFGITLL